MRTLRGAIRQVLDLEGIGEGIVELLDRLGLAVVPVGGRQQRSAVVQTEDLPHRGEPVAERDRLSVRRLGLVVAHVGPAPIAHEADAVGCLVVAVLGGEDELGRWLAALADENAARHVAGHRSAGECQRRRRQVDEADQLVTGRARAEVARPAHDQRQVGATVVDPALVARKAAAIVGEEEHHRVVGDAVLVEHGEQLADPGVEAGDVVVVPRELDAHRRRVGVVGRDRDRRRVGRHRRRRRSTGCWAPSRPTPPGRAGPPRMPRRRPRGRRAGATRAGSARVPCASPDPRRPRVTFPSLPPVPASPRPSG
jgi:hypothetical protein